MPELVGAYRGLANVDGLIVAPGPGGTERLYASYIYHDVALDILALDPDRATSTVLANPAPSEFGARAIALGADSNVYFGTAPNAHLLKLATSEATLTDLGRPSPTEQVIWELARGSDNKLYGGTWPNAKLVQLDPATGAMVDLGRMDADEQYVRYVAASDDGFIYAGIGSSRMKIVAYEIATGTHQQLLPSELQAPGFAEVYTSTNRKVYARVGTKAFELNNWTLRPIDRATAGPRVAMNRTKDGRLLSVRGRTLLATDAVGRVTEREFDYAGHELPVFRLGLAANGTVYASTLMPARLLRVDEDARRIEEVAELGTGEVYNFLPAGTQLLMAGYSTLAPLMIFDSARSDRGPTPRAVHFADEDPAWRPLAFVRGPHDKVYVGAIAGYGKLDGPLCEWDIATGRVTTFTNVVPHQSISALTVKGDRLIGGSSVLGGTGSRPMASIAQVFEWDPSTRAVTRSVELPGAIRVDGLTIGPAGDIYVLSGTRMFVIDGRSFEIAQQRELPFAGGTLWQSIASDRDGRIWGLASEGVFAIEPDSLDATLVLKPAKKITAGFAIRGDTILFATGSEIYRYRLPTGGSGAARRGNNQKANSVTVPPS